MSISSSPPVSLQAVRNNFNKSGRIGAEERYVRDFRQIGSDEEWDLLGYKGQAYGFQHQIYGDGWAGGSFGASKLPLDQTDKRIDGRVYYTNSVSYARLGEDSSGKYAELAAVQGTYPGSPGSVAMNGIFYAKESGSYRLRAKVETDSSFYGGAEAGIFVFGYRYGYLDGDRVNYSLWGYGSKPGPNQTLNCDVGFSVQYNHRHVVVNVNGWLPGESGGGRAAFRVRDLTIEKV